MLMVPAGAINSCPVFFNISVPLVTSDTKKNHENEKENRLAHCLKKIMLCYQSFLLFCIQRSACCNFNIRMNESTSSHLKILTTSARIIIRQFFYPEIKNGLKTFKHGSLHLKII
jgi:hypothetical protein